MTLTPLGDRILIRPDVAPTMTASGLHISEHWKPEQTGTVVAVGRVTHPRKDEAFALADRLDDVVVEGEADVHAAEEDSRTIVDAVQLLRDLTGREPLVKPGDEVIFSWQVGQEVWINDGAERYLLLREDDLLAVVDYDNTVDEGSVIHG